MQQNNREEARDAVRVRNDLEPETEKESTLGMLFSRLVSGLIKEHEPGFVKRFTYTVGSRSQQKQTIKEGWRMKIVCSVYDTNFFY